MAKTVGIKSPATIRHGSAAGQKTALTSGKKQVAKGFANRGTKGGRDLARQGIFKARVASGDPVKAIKAAHIAHGKGTPGFGKGGGYARVVGNDATAKRRGVGGGGGHQRRDSKGRFA